MVNELGLDDQTLRKGIKAAAQGKLKGAGSKMVTPDAMELSRLRAEVARLKREDESIKKCGGVLREGCSGKYAWMHAWMHAQSKAHALTEMCAALDVSFGGYRAWKRGETPDRERLTDAQMMAVICAIHAELKGTYAGPRMMRELRLRGFTAGKERVER